MKKILITIIGLTLLFFSSNSLAACDCDDGCDDCWPDTSIGASIWCKCVTECNPEYCFEDGGDDCIYAWTGEAYTDFSTCMEEMLPYDMLWFGLGSTCPLAACRFFKDWLWFIEFPYKNLGQCVADQASLLGEPIEGLFTGDFTDCNDSPTYVDACECCRRVLWEDS